MVTLGLINELYQSQQGETPFSGPSPPHKLTATDLMPFECAEDEGPKGPVSPMLEYTR